jgi:hypothetical protein
VFEPIVQDYIRLALELDRDAFVRKIEVPVLVATSLRPGQSFQQAPTRMMDEHEREQVGKHAPRFSHQAQVLELRREGQPGIADEVWVGRAEENAIVLDEEEISARHALFRRIRTRGVYTLEDLESTNGTMVNRTELLSGRAIQLKDGDTLSFGNLTFLFFYPAGFYDVITGMQA